MKVKENLIEMFPRDVLGQRSSPYFVCIHKDSLILAIDEGGSQLLGFKHPDEIVGKSIYDFLYTKEQKTATERIKLLEQGTILSASIMTFSISGVPMDLEVESNPIIFNGEAVIKSVLRFLIPHHQSFSKNNHSTPLILNSNKGIIITNSNGIIQSASESFTRLTGFSTEEVIGSNPRMWKSESYTPAFYEKMWKSILTLGCWQGELWNKRRDGSHYLMKVNIYSILNKEGSLVNYIAVYTDLTEIDKLAKQLKEREEQYRTLVELSPSSIILTQNEKVVYANPPAVSLLGMENTTQLIGKRVDKFLTDHSNIDAKITFKEKSEITFEDQLEKDGSMLDIEVSSSVITFQGQESVLTVIKEITERKNIERELRESEEQYRFIAENSSDMIGRLSRDGSILYISPACRQILGYRQEELIGSDIFQKFHPEDLKSLLEEYGDPKDFTGIATFSYRMQHKSGKYIWGETTVRSVKDKSGKLSGMMFATRDVTARRTIEMQLRESNLLLRKISSLDGLTEIYNRRAFDEFMQTEWLFACEHRSPISLLLLDIDYFKKYNDTYGHIEGDECLKTVARTLEQFFHEKGYYAARYGGEEFAVVLPNTDPHKAFRLAEEFRNNIQSLQIENRNSKVSEFVTISIGLSSLSPTLETDIKDILNFTDRALYKAKQNGRNRTEICKNL